MYHKIPKYVDWRQIKRFVVFCLFVLCIVFFAALLYLPLLVPISISLFFSYLLFPFVKHLKGFGRFRPVVILAVILLFLSFVVLLFVKISPVIYEQAMDIVNLVPQAIAVATHRWVPIIRDFVLKYELMDAQGFDLAWQKVDIMNQMSEQVKQALTTIWQTAPQIIGTVLNFFLIPLVIFFLLVDLGRLQSYLWYLVPKDLKKPTRQFISKVDCTLKNVLKGQAMVAGILGVLYVIGLSAVGLESAITIGIIAGICRIVPYMDILVGGVLSAIVLSSGFAGWGQVLSVVVVFVVVQVIDGMLITPRVVGERVGLHPLLVILSILSFGSLFGFWGVIMAIPVIALVKSLGQTLIPFYLASPLYDPRLLKKHKYYRNDNQKQRKRTSQIKRNKPEKA